MPKSVIEGGAAASSYRSFSLSSAFDLDETAAVWEEISALADDTARRKMKVRIRRTSVGGGYSLTREGDKVWITACDSDMAFAALQSLKQLLRAGYGRDIVIGDYPDMEKRVFMDDISRGAVPTVEQMKRQIRYISELKYNGYMLYNENILRTESHPDVAPADGFLTMEDMDEICRYAASYHIEVIGCLQSFGHFEKTLALPQYRDMGATASMIDPHSPKARKFLDDVIGELAAHSSSEYFCVCCDETFDLENRSDKEELYAGHLLYLREILQKSGKKMLAFGDMFMKYPAMLDKMPEDVVLVTWNYDAPADFSPWLEPFKGRAFWIAPGTHSSSRMLPDIIAGEGNRRFITEGLAGGAKGSIVCTWDESTYHSVKHLNYGVAQFAETMWDGSRNLADEDFRSRYERVFFGAECGITDVYSQMMRLGEIPMFASMNDRVFYQRFTPAPGMPLAVDGSQLHKADSILRVASEGMDAAAAKIKRNSEETEVWRYIIDCYRFMVDSRLTMLSLDRLDKGRECLRLEAEADALCAAFSKWWKEENQPHSYSAGVELFRNMKDAVEAVRTAEPGSLVTLDRRNSYMCFWLTTLTTPEEGEPALDPWPTAGRRFSLPGREGVWTKSESLNGLGMDCNHFYSNPAPGNTMWAYAMLTSGRECEVKMLLGYVGRLELSLNGEKVFAGELSPSFTPDTYEIPLKFKEGRNHMVIRLEKQFPECSFSAFIDGPRTRNSKHRYTLTDYE